MIPGAEAVISHLWQAWIRAGRKPDAAWQGNARVLRPTARYRGSLATVSVLLTMLLAWLVSLIPEFPGQLPLFVLIAAAGFVWLLAVGGTVNAFRERVVLDASGITQRSMFRTRQVRWEDLAWSGIPAEQDGMILDDTGQRLRIGANLDGLGTLQDELKRHEATNAVIQLLADDIES